MTTKILKTVEFCSFNIHPSHFKRVMNPKKINPENYPEAGQQRFKRLPSLDKGENKVSSGHMQLIFQDFSDNRGCCETYTFAPGLDYH